MTERNSMSGIEYQAAVEAGELPPPSPQNTLAPCPTSEEQKFEVDGQWFYRGNQSPRWFFKAGPRTGISSPVPSGMWPLLEHITELRASAPCPKEDEGGRDERVGVKRAVITAVIPTQKGATRCTFRIEKEWPGHAALLSWRHCKNKTSHPSGKCWQHRSCNEK